MPVGAGISPAIHIKIPNIQLAIPGHSALAVLVVESLGIYNPHLYELQKGRFKVS